VARRLFFGSAGCGLFPRRRPSQAIVSKLTSFLLHDHNKRAKKREKLGTFVAAARRAAAQCEQLLNREV
jgi:hypothetical protein